MTNMEGNTEATQPPPMNSGAAQPPQNTAEDHLNRLLVSQVEQPWYTTFFRNIKEAINPPKLPPLEVTSKPVAVKDIWGDYRYGKQAGVSSTLIHIGLAVLLFTLGTSKTVQNAVKQTVTLVAPDLAPYMPDLKPKPQIAQGGGGGGDRSPLPASKGQAPKFSARQFTPPMAVVHNENPKLLMEPTLIGQADAKLPNVNMPVWGDPLAKVGPPSNGPGSGGGIGSGSGGGIGPGKGPGYGPGEGGGFGGGVFRVGGGVSTPIPIYKVEPEYSEEARKAKFQGTVVLSIIIDERGTPTNFKVVRPLGLGLDEKAIEAVQKWRFRPGMKEGKAVAVLATVEVNFRLL
jgi:TonB family protein